MERDVRDGVVVRVRLGHEVVDRYLEFVAIRSRPNTLLAAGFDLKVFFTVVPKQPAAVTTADVFSFLAAQRSPRRGETVVRLEDGESGLSARTIKRRLSSVSGLFGYLLACGEPGIERNPVPYGMSTRSPSSRRGNGPALIRTPRTLPRVLNPHEVDAFVAALRTHRDRAMVFAMLFGGLRRCEVLGLRAADVNPGTRRVFVADGKGGAQRHVPVSGRFFIALGEYLAVERPEGCDSEFLFVALKGPRRGGPLSAYGLDEIVQNARDRAGLPRLTCHQLRHTCLTRLREAGMPLEALQHQAGHRNIETTRIYTHLTDEWLTGQYVAAMAAIDADLARLAAGPR